MKLERNSSDKSQISKKFIIDLPKGSRSDKKRALVFFCSQQISPLQPVKNGTDLLTQNYLKLQKHT